MTTERLALLGGTPVRSNLFPAHNFIGEEEREAANRVLDSGVLSRFLGSWHEHFYGGREVQALEQEWAESYGMKHAVSVNSATSGLHAAVGAIGVGPGDEVIVTPMSMVCSATAPIVFNAVPIFADVDPRTLNLDPNSVRERITSRTKAIIVVHLLGQPADMDPIMEIAATHGLKVIEDASQSPFARYKGRFSGTIGHIGVFSLNVHKHIQTGEGGVIVTNDDTLAERMQMIRNHAEAVAMGKPVESLVNLVGFNWRMCEIEAAIGRSQLKKGEDLVQRRRQNVAYLEERLDGLPGLSLPYVLPDTEHSYYYHPLFYDEAEAGVDRGLLVEALRAELAPYELREDEGVLISYGGAIPIYRYPMFQELVGYGSVSCPFKCPHYKGEVDYSDGICPGAEEAHRTVITHDLMKPQLTKSDLDDVVAAFHKIFGNLDQLRSAASKRPGN